MSEIEGWFRRLEDGRLEVFLKLQGVEGHPNRRLHITAPEAEAHELVDWFEAKTGMRVGSPKWRRTVPKPMEGQMSLTMGELSSDATLPGDA